MTRCALFDLDHTLIDGDSDYLWGEYLASIGAVPALEHRRENRRFLEEYRAGRLDQQEFLGFQLAPLARHPREQLLRWRTEYVREWIEPLVLPRAEALVEDHRRRGHVLVIAPSTNAFITAPFAPRFGIVPLLATEPECRDGQFTGRHLGTPCFGGGKVSRFEQWVREQGVNCEESWFYSDSHTDLPLLQAVDHPVAVDPDQRLLESAQHHGWPVLSLRASPA